VKRLAVQHLKERFGLSQRRACSLINIQRSTQQYMPHRLNEEAIRARLRELAQLRRRYGCPRLHVLLKREGLVINHKRTERLYREEGLSLRLKKRKKRISVLRVVMPPAARTDQRWSMDFVSDALDTGRRFKVLTIVDDYSRECPAMEVDTSLNGKRVVQALERLAALRGLPEVITVDNGPEFSGKTLDEWAYKNKVHLNFIRPGKPVENAYIESFNGKFRDECLNENRFLSLQQARQIIETWRKDYNEVRPHSSLNNLTPQEFARQQQTVTSLQTAL
jgi:putative transposase